MQTSLLLMCSDFQFDIQNNGGCCRRHRAVRQPTEPHARPRKTGAEKSRDMTIYGECGADGPRRPRPERRVSGAIDTFPSLEALP
jgi:hypothetical protein